MHFAFAKSNKEFVVEKLNQFVSALFAGIMISVGGTIYLSCDNKFIGAALFSIGLLSIFVFKFMLFTSKAGYIVLEKSKGKYAIYLIIVYLGNFIGTFLTAKLIALTKIYEKLHIDKFIEQKTSGTLLSTFILAIFCGLLMFIAAETYNNSKSEPTRTIMVFLCVMTFILAGFEHCVANMFYFTLAGEINGNTILYILMATLGNAVGGMLIPFRQLLVKQVKA